MSKRRPPSHPSESMMSGTVQRSVARLLVVLTLLVVVAFIGANVYAQRRAAAMDAQAAALVDGIAPAIERIAAARGALHRMVAAARAGAAGAMPPDEAARIAGLEQSRLDGHFDTFIEHETAPPALRDQAVAAADAVEGRVKSLARLLRAHDPSAARLQAAAIDDLAEAADQAMQQLVLWNAAEAKRKGEAIRTAREHASHVSYAVHAVASGVALAALVVALMVARRSEHLERQRDLVIDQRNRLAEARAQELDGFACRVAHDIKNPLSTISLRVSLAQGADAVPVQVRSSLDAIHKGVHQLTRVVDDLLGFARAGGRPRGTEGTALRPVIAAIVEEVAPLAHDLGADLVVDDTSIAEAACAPGVLISIVGNLVRNALKFLPDGAGERRVTIRGRDGGGRLHVEVEDTGPGIVPGQEQEIFRAYVRGETSRPGLGLGLATVKRLVDAHGGVVGVRPGARVGCCFWFELPHASSPAGDAYEAADSDDNKPLRTAKRTRSVSE